MNIPQYKEEFDFQDKNTWRFLKAMEIPQLRPPCMRTW